MAERVGELSPGVRWLSPQRGVGRGYLRVGRECRQCADRTANAKSNERPAKNFPLRETRFSANTWHVPSGKSRSQEASKREQDTTKTSPAQCGARGRAVEIQHRPERHDPRRIDVRMG